MTKFSGDNRKPRELSPLVLAYIGDGVFEIFVREHLIIQSDLCVNKLHKQATKIVNCAAQAQFFRKIESILTDEEIAIFKRGRNAKSSVPKNADMADYRTATGVECLIGYLYLDNQQERIGQLLEFLGL